MKTKWLIGLLLVNAAYIAALPSATIFYVANVLLHPLVGIAALVVLCWQWRRNPKIALLLASTLLGGFLLIEGATNGSPPWFRIRVAISAGRRLSSARTRRPSKAIEAVYQPAF